MVEMEERELLLASLKGYLEELQDTGVDELLFASQSAGAAAVDDSLAACALDPAVSGVGDPRARLLFVASGAGFAAPSGELLAKVIQAMGFAAEEVFLLSFAAPPSEAASRLRESLLGRIAAVAPEVVVALGEQAAQILLATGEPIAKLRGRFRDLAATTMMATLHPDQLLADPALKREVWNEMQQVMGRLRTGG